MTSTRWLAAALTVSVLISGWLGWREIQWRHAYSTDMVGQLVYDVNMANRQLLRARDAGAGQERLEAMAAAHGYLVSAHTEALSLMERISGDRPGKAAYMPGHYVAMLLQYARDLSPELPQEALQRRIDLLAGLEAALSAGGTAYRLGPNPAYTGDMNGLKQRLDEFFRPMAAKVEPPEVLRFADPPTTPTVIARQQGRELTIRLEWPHTYMLFPSTAPLYELLIRAGGRTTVSSDAPVQPRLGAGELRPFTLADAEGSMHSLLSPSLPWDWGEGSYQVIRVPEGLSQTLTIRLPDETRPSLFLARLRSGETAVPIRIAPEGTGTP